jgi:hypothetical protein
MRVVLPESPNDERETNQRNKREQRAITVLAEPRDQARAGVAERHEDVGAEQDDEPEDEDKQTHT